MGIQTDTIAAQETYSVKTMRPRGSSIRKRPRGNQYIGPRTGEKYDIINNIRTGEPVYITPGSSQGTIQRI